LESTVGCPQTAGVGMTGGKEEKEEEEEKR
jgi:hypothetical protein